MSSLYRRPKKDGIYWLSYRQHGKSFCRSLKTRDKSTAIYYKAEIDRNLIEGRHDVPTQNAECGLALTEYMTFNELRRTRAVNQMVQSRIDKFLKWSQVVRIGQITEARLQEYLNMRLQEVSAYEANNIIVGLKGWLNWCVRSHIIAENPIAGIKKFKIPETTRRFLSKDQIVAVLKAAADPGIYTDHKPTLLPFVATAIYAGLRKTELFNLEWTDIDFTRNVLTVRNKAGFTTKSKKNRTIELHPKLKAILAKHKKDTGRCFDVTNFRRIFGRIARAIKMPDLKIHELRHTFASQALMAGIPMPTVSKWLGHASFSTTQIYCHIAKTHERSEIRRLKF